MCICVSVFYVWTYVCKTVDKTNNYENNMWDHINELYLFTF